MVIDWLLKKIYENKNVSDFARHKTVKMTEIKVFYTLIKEFLNIHGIQPFTRRSRQKYGEVEYNVWESRFSPLQRREKVRSCLLYVFITSISKYIFVPHGRQRL